MISTKGVYLRVWSTIFGSTYTGTKAYPAVPAPPPQQCYAPDRVVHPRAKTLLEIFREHRESACALSKTEARCAATPRTAWDAANAIVRHKKDSSISPTALHSVA